MSADYYEILGVSRTATEAEIKSAYRRLAREYHPDVNPDPAAEERFKEIGVAFKTLSDPELRSRYDRYGPEGVNVENIDLSDIFESFFGGLGGFGFGQQQRRRGPARGRDVQTRVRIDFAEAVLGVTRDVTYRAARPCQHCAGSGAEPPSRPTVCKQCGGAGQVQQMRRTILGNVMSAYPCPVCNGEGRLIETPCTKCAGTGLTAATETVSVSVPGGVEDGTELRLSGRGDSGPRGGPPGDLYLTLRVQADERWRRDGLDLIHEVWLPFTVATLGGDVDVPLVTGETHRLEVAPGTQPGTAVRLRSQGVPRLRGRGRGDLVVLYMIAVPKELPEEQTALLRQFAEMRGEEVAPAPSGLFGRIREAFGR